MPHTAAQLCLLPILLRRARHAAALLHLQLGTVLHTKSKLYTNNLPLLCILTDRESLEFIGEGTQRGNTTEPDGSAA